MNSANDVSLLLNQLKSEGVPLQTVAWKTALACLGWPYVYGGRGELCTPKNRRARDYIKYPTIKTKCKNFSGDGSCSGCQWYPNGAKTRFFDCRGFTYWVLLQVYGWKLMGAGATSQWNDANNWKAKGPIATMPKNTLVCLFVQKGKTMEHTGFGYNNETVECSVTVKHYTKRNAKWTHWAIPACITDEGEIPMDNPEEKPTDTTLRRGSKGEYVTLLQTMLYSKGYDLGSYGIDGDFGRATEAAVKQYQQDMGLKADGIVGKETWQALESAKPVPTYNVTIPGLKEADANELLSKYPGSYKTAVRG